MSDMPAPEAPPPVIEANGPRIVNSFRKASAIYYVKSKRIFVVAEDFVDARKALSGLEVKVQRGGDR